MKKLLILSGVCAMAALVSQTAQAEVKVRAGTSNTSYTADFTNLFWYNTASSSYKSTNLGLTFIADSGLYFDIASSSGEGTHENYNAYTAVPQPLKRTDLALILGNSDVSESGVGTTTYVGVKSGTTLLGAPVGTVTPFGTISWSETNFTAAGLVFGGGVSFPIASGSGGSIGLNGGLGVMSATWKANCATCIEFKSDSAVGVSLGLSYTYPFTSALGIVIDYKGNSYKYNFSRSDGTTFALAEKVNSVGASLYAKF